MVDQWDNQEEYQIYQLKGELGQAFNNDGYLHPNTQGTSGGGTQSHVYFLNFNWKDCQKRQSPSISRLSENHHENLETNNQMVTSSIWNHGNKLITYYLSNWWHSPSLQGFSYLMRFSLPLLHYRPLTSDAAHLTSQRLQENRAQTDPGSAAACGVAARLASMIWLRTLFWRMIAKRCKMQDAWVVTLMGLALKPSNPRV